MDRTPPASHFYILVKDAEDQLNEAEGKVEDVKRQADRVAMLPGQLGLDAKIAAIRKRIEMSRDRAGMVWRFSMFI